MKNTMNDPGEHIHVSKSERKDTKSVQINLLKKSIEDKEKLLRKIRIEILERRRDNKDYPRVYLGGKIGRSKEDRHIFTGGDDERHFLTDALHDEARSIRIDLKIDKLKLNLLTGKTNSNSDYHLGENTMILTGYGDY